MSEGALEDFDSQRLRGSNQYYIHFQGCLMKAISGAIDLGFQSLSFQIMPFIK